MNFDGAEIPRRVRQNASAFWTAIGAPQGSKRELRQAIAPALPAFGTSMCFIAV
jgi:hypothetical protein